MTSTVPFVSNGAANGNGKTTTNSIRIPRFQPAFVNV